MLARVGSYVLQGIDALTCEVEVDLAEGSENAPRMIVGLPDASVKESLQRVQSALENSGYFFPPGRVVVNLAPAELRKEGPLYDLPIAIGMLMSTGVIRTGAKTARPHSGTPVAPQHASMRDLHDIFAGAEARPASPARTADPQPAQSDGLDPRQFLFAGELALDGRLRPVRGVIAMAMLARSRGLRGVIIPRDNAAEAAVVPGIEAIGVSTLSEVVGLIAGHLEIEPTSPVDVESLLRSSASPIDFADVRGQEAVKRAIVVAAAGSHNLLMLGPAGTGKTMMARALPGVLPRLTADEALEITRVYSAAGLLPSGQGLITSRPVRTPHHTASAAAIVGGGQVPKPGEVSLAHRGVLFLDELPEFPRDVLETLRQPLEDHVVTIARSHSAVKFPANIMLVAAMNPTPKGDVAPGDVGKKAMERYLSKLSGPLIDRIDIHVEAPAVPWKQLSAGLDPALRNEPRGTSSRDMLDQVMHARERQHARQGPTTPNARLSGRQLDSLAPMSEDARTLLGQAMTELGLSARAFDKVRRVSRTIADLAGADAIDLAHVAEAVQYRLLDRKT
jgi:magnesium chelatase family protein